MRIRVTSPKYGEEMPTFGWENRSEALVKGFIQVGRAVELSPEHSEGA